MKAEIRGYSVTENEDLSTYEPEAQQVFGFTLLFEIGIQGQEGSDFFEVEVASPAFLERLASHPLFLRHTILATDYNIPAAVALVRKYVEKLEEDSWEKLASKISRVLRWEFEDYKG
ncbi:immunity 8 family protein [Hymenobacter swuensis]|uniref:Uncharacterized protein n=1 Tax=Hymenobacter swuensis DY53 TaxID=1227739 RepID=W8EUM9_9BACT|nr:immunity 8 family protein [Hymenobacter swuensis]AHJ95432.1 hypothetical protein Hsw_PA0099 [Hymenobacter swuensis DY53]